MLVLDDEADFAVTCTHSRTDATSRTGRRLRENVALINKQLFILCSKATGATNTRLVQHTRTCYKQGTVRISRVQLVTETRRELCVCESGFQPEPFNSAKAYNRTISRETESCTPRVPLCLGNGREVPLKNMVSDLSRGHCTLHFLGIGIEASAVTA